jgi:ComF family protein
MIDRVRLVLDAVLTAVVAPPCPVCGQVLERPLAGAVCDSCWQSIAAGPASSVPLTAALQLTTAIGEYDGTLREILHALKYDGRRSVAPPLSRLMRAHAGAILADADAIVPVPLHRRRRRQRGFNQAEDLARGLGVPIVDALRRLRPTRPQVELPAAERHQNVTNAFAMRRWWRGAPQVHDRVLVLVDDVTTTGATLDACARVLIRAGAREVRAVTAARVATSRR